MSSRLLCLLPSLLLAWLSPTLVAAESVVPFGANWKFQDDGTDQATLNISVNDSEGNPPPDPGQPFDLQAFIDGELEAGKTHITLPPGRHRVSPTLSSTTHLKFTGLTGITIDGTGAEMICTVPTRAISLNNCSNLTIIGLKIDYDPLPFTQGEITAISPDERTLTIELQGGYADSDTLVGDKLEIFDDVTGELVTRTYYGTVFTATGPRQLTAFVDSTSDRFEEVGDIAVIKSLPTGVSTIPHAVGLDACQNVTLQSVELYASNSFGFLETHCSSNQYLDCVIDRRSQADEIRLREHPRMRSLQADAYHSKFAVNGPRYIGCIARYNGDDEIAINGEYHFVAASSVSNGKTVLRVIGKGATTPDLAVGETVELVSYTGERIEDAIIEIYDDTATTPVTQAEIDFLLAQTSLRGAAASTANATEAYSITLDRTVTSLPLGSLIASTERMGNGFEVRNCILGPNRSRGILVKASDGIISGNTLIGNWGSAIKIAPEYSWFEAGSSSNVTISNNMITGCRGVSIAVEATSGEGNTAPVGGHNDIRVIGNTITASSNPGIVITSTRNLSLYDNTISAPDNSLVVYYARNRYGRNEDPNREIYLLNNESVSTVPPTTKLEQWRDRYHIAQDGSEDLVDFSGDGIPALAKLAFNLGNPRDQRNLNRQLDIHAPENGGLPVVVTTGQLQFNYVQLAGPDTDLTYTSEYSPDLTASSWDSIQNFPSVLQSTTTDPIVDSDYEQVSHLLAEPSADKGFFRVKVTTP